MDQEEINQLIRAWVVLFVGDNANPVLYGGDVLSRVDTARAERTAGMNTERTQTQKGQGGRGMNATVLPITYIPIGEHTDRPRVLCDRAWRRSTRFNSFGGENGIKPNRARC